IALPFARLFTFGWQGSIETKERVIAFNLAREKIEEVRSLPYELVKSDFENFKDLYQDNPDLNDAFGNKDAFEKVFSDVISVEKSKDEKEKEYFDNFLENYKKAFLRDYEWYPDEFSNFRRLLDVDDKYDRSVPARLKKVVVRVFDKDNHKLAEVVTLVGLHK
ncbi:hypothetical protein HYY75_05945, partial [bacterium]|nr:hypothetical protein [bacterium]